MVPPGYRATYRVDAVNSRGYKVQAIADGERIRGVGITIRKISDRVWRRFLRKYRAAFLGSANAVKVTTVGGVRVHTNPSVNINTRLVSDHNYLLDKLIPFLASVVDQTHEFLIEVKMEVNGAGKIVWLTPRDINNVDTLKQIIKDGDIADIAAAYSEGYKSADWILDFARGGFKSITSARVVNNLKRLSNRIERGERQEFFKYKLRSEYALSVGPIVARYGIYPDYVKARYKQCCLYYCFEREGSFSRTKLLLLNNIIAKEIRSRNVPISKLKGVSRQLDVRIVLHRLKKDLRRKDGFTEQKECMYHFKERCTCPKERKTIHICALANHYMLFEKGVQLHLSALHNAVALTNAETRTVKQLHGWNTYYMSKKQMRAKKEGELGVKKNAGFPNTLRLANEMLKHKNKFFTEELISQDREILETPMCEMYVPGANVAPKVPRGVIEPDGASRPWGVEEVNIFHNPVEWLGRFHELYCAKNKGKVPTYADAAKALNSNDPNVGPVNALTLAQLDAKLQNGRGWTYVLVNHRQLEAAYATRKLNGEIPRREDRLELEAKKGQTKEDVLRELTRELGRVQLVAFSMFKNTDAPTAFRDTTGGPAIENIRGREKNLGKLLEISCDSETYSQPGSKQIQRVYQIAGTVINYREDKMGAHILEEWDGSPLEGRDDDFICRFFDKCIKLLEEYNDTGVREWVANNLLGEWKEVLEEKKQELRKQRKWTKGKQEWEHEKERWKDACEKEAKEHHKTEIRLTCFNARFDEEGIRHTSPLFDSRCTFQTEIAPQNQLLQRVLYYKNGTKKVKFIIACSTRKFGQCKLSDLPGMYGLDCGDKGIFPYGILTRKHLYTPTGLTLRKIYKDSESDFRTPHSKRIKEVKADGSFVYGEAPCWDKWETFKAAVEGHNCWVEGSDKRRVDILKYSRVYLKQDCEVQGQALIAYRNMFLEVTRELCDSRRFLTISSLGGRFLDVTTYDNSCYAIRGPGANWVWENQVVGGRVLMGSQKPQIITRDESMQRPTFDTTTVLGKIQQRAADDVQITKGVEINANDQCSQYPYGLVLSGILRSVPRLLTGPRLSLEWLVHNTCQFYIRVKFVKKLANPIKNNFPATSYRDQEGRRVWTNAFPDDTTHLCWESLYSVLLWNRVYSTDFADIEVLEGYAFTEGYSNKISEEVQALYKRRSELKQPTKEQPYGNPLQNAIKLMLNACSFGKTVQKFHETKTVFGDKRAHLFDSLNKGYFELSVFAMEESRDKCTEVLYPTLPEISSLVKKLDGIKGVSRARGFPQTSADFRTDLATIFQPATAAEALRTFGWSADATPRREVYDMEMVKYLLILQQNPEQCPAWLRSKKKVYYTCPLHLKAKATGVKNKGEQIEYGELIRRQLLTIYLDGTGEQSFDYKLREDEHGVFGQRRVFDSTFLKKDLAQVLAKLPERERSEAIGTLEPARHTRGFYTGLAAQRMKRELRECLFARQYIDCDMKNAFVALIVGYIECRPDLFPTPGDYSAIEEYVMDRKRVLVQIMGELGVERGEAKVAILASVFKSSSMGNKRAAKSPKLVELTKQLDDVKQKILSDDPKWESRGKNTHDGSNMSMLAQDMQRAVLDEAVKLLESQGFEVGALIFDGMLVRKREDGHTVDFAAMNAALQEMRPTLWKHVEFLEKPFEDVVAIDYNKLTTTQDLTYSLPTPTERVDRRRRRHLITKDEIEARFRDIVARKWYTCEKSAAEEFEKAVEKGKGFNTKRKFPIAAMLYLNPCEITEERRPDPTKAPVEDGKNHEVYLIAGRSEKDTYIGYSMDPERRLRQHNREIAGGAEGTMHGGPWRIVKRVRGFRTKSEALSCETALQQPRGKAAFRGCAPRDADESALTWRTRLFEHVEENGYNKRRMLRGQAVENLFDRLATPDDFKPAGETSSAGNVLTTVLAKRRTLTYDEGQCILANRAADVYSREESTHRWKIKISQDKRSYWTRAHIGGSILSHAKLSLELFDKSRGVDSESKTAYGDTDSVHVPVSANKEIKEAFDANRSPWQAFKMGCAYRSNTNVLIPDGKKEVGLWKRYCEDKERQKIYGAPEEMVNPFGNELGQFNPDWEIKLNGKKLPATSEEAVYNSNKSYAVLMQAKTLDEDPKTVYAYKVKQKGLPVNDLWHDMQERSQCEAVKKVRGTYCLVHGAGGGCKCKCRAEFDHSTTKHVTDTTPLNVYRDAVLHPIRRGEDGENAQTGLKEPNVVTITSRFRYGSQGCTIGVDEFRTLRCTSREAKRSREELLEVSHADRTKKHYATRIQQALSRRERQILRTMKRSGVGHVIRQ